MATTATDTLEARDYAPAEPATQAEIERFAAAHAYRLGDLPTGLHGIIAAYQHQVYALTGRRPDVLDAVLALSAARDRMEVQS